MTIPANPIYIGINSIQAPMMMYPFRIENPFGGGMSTIDIVEDNNIRIFYDMFGAWIKIEVKAGAEGKLFTPGSMWGDVSGIFNGSNLATTATEYFVGNGNLTTIPPTIFPPNGESTLRVTVTCDPTSGTASNHILELASHGDGVADNNDSLQGTIKSFSGNVITPFN